MRRKNEERRRRRSPPAPQIYCNIASAFCQVKRVIVGLITWPLDDFKEGVYNLGTAGGFVEENPNPISKAAFKTRRHREMKRATTNEVISCRIDEDTGRKLHEVLSEFRSHDLPIRIVSDFVRYAVEAAVEWAVEELLVEATDSWLRNQMVEDKLRRQLNDSLDLDARTNRLISQLKEVLKVHNGMGNWSGGAAALETFWLAYHEIQDGVWKSSVRTKYRNDGDLRLMLDALRSHQVDTDEPSEEGEE